MLVVKKSRIPNAGKGLYTTSRIRKGDIIVEYKGEKITWAECERRNEKTAEHMAYFFFISKNNSIDGSKTLDSLARYVNDAAGTTQSKKIRNNAEYQVIKSKAYVVATKNIPAGSEIFVQYGQDYWDVMQKSPSTSKKK